MGKKRMIKNSKKYMFSIKYEGDHPVTNFNKILAMNKKINDLESENLVIKKKLIEFEMENNLLKEQIFFLEDIIKSKEKDVKKEEPDLNVETVKDEELLSLHDLYTEKNTCVESFFGLNDKIWEPCNL